MKEWKKPLVKVVVVEEDVIATSAEQDSSDKGVYGKGFQDEGDSWIFSPSN